MQRFCLLLLLLAGFSSCSLYREIEIINPNVSNPVAPAIYIHADKNKSCFVAANWEFQGENFSGELSEVNCEELSRFYQEYNRKNISRDEIHLFTKKIDSTELENNSFSLEKLRYAQLFSPNRDYIYNQRLFNKLLRQDVQITDLTGKSLYRIKNPRIGLAGISGTLEQVPDEPRVQAGRKIVSVNLKVDKLLEVQTKKPETINLGYEDLSDMTVLVYDYRKSFLTYASIGAGLIAILVLSVDETSSP
ncbi:MAG: hypothetical protein ACPF8V_07455 [Luteibaculum sp.]